MTTPGAVACRMHACGTHGRYRRTRLNAVVGVRDGNDSYRRAALVARHHLRRRRQVDMDEVLRPRPPAVAEAFVAAEQGGSILCRRCVPQQPDEHVDVAAAPSLRLECPVKAPEQAEKATPGERAAARRASSNADVYDNVRQAAKAMCAR